MIARLAVETAFLAALVTVGLALHRMESRVPASDCRADGVIVRGLSAVTGAALMGFPFLVLIVGGHAIGAFR